MASTTIGELWVSIGVKADDLKKGLNSAVSAVRTAKSEAAAVSGLIATGMVAATAAAGAFGLASLKMAGDMEQSQVAFSVMLGSAEKAKTVLEELKTFAAETPFEFPELQAAGRKLLAFGTSAEDLQSELRRLGDISSGIGAPIGEIAELYGKAQVQGRLFAEDINQFQGRGIPIVQALAKNLGVVPEQIRQMVTDGKIGFKDLQEAVKSLTNEGSQFGGMMEKQSQTLLGSVSTVTDNVKTVVTAFGESLMSAFNVTEKVQAFGLAMQGIAKDLAGITNTIKEAGLQAAIDSLIDPKVQAGIVALGGALIGSLVPGLIAAYTQFVAMLPTITATALAMAPWIAAGAALAATAYLIYRNWEPIKTFFSGLWTDIKTHFSQSITRIIEWVKEWGATILLFTTGPFGAMLIYIIKHWEDVKATFLKYGGLILDGLERLVGGIWSIIKTIAEPFIWLGATAVEWGSKLVEGLWNGLSSMGGWLLDKIWGWAVGIKDWVNEAFGIESPSKVFAEIGEQLSAGLIQGLAKTSNKVKDQALSVVSEVIGAVTNLTQEYNNNISSALDKLASDEAQFTQEYVRQLSSREQALYGWVGLFEQIPKTAKISGDQLISNLKEQVMALATWRSQVQELARKGISEGLLKEIQDMGPNAQPQIAALISMTDEELTSYQKLWKDKHELAKVQAVGELVDLKEQTNAEIEALRLKTNEQLLGYAVDFVGKISDLKDDTLEKLGELSKGGIGIGESLIMQIMAGIANKKEDLSKAIQDLTSMGSVLPGGGVVTVPAMAGGGIVTRPTLALIGESGAEAVVPLDRYGGGNNITVNIYGPDPDEVVDVMYRRLVTAGVRW